MSFEFAHPELLWNPAQLQARLADPNLVLLDLRATAEVLHGVIPGAQHLDLYGIGLTRTTPPALLEEFVNLMRSLFAMRGVRLDRTVVLYEHNQTGSRVGRAFWLLDYLKHEDVHILDGGMAAWLRAGLPVTHDMTASSRGSLRRAARPEIHMTADELRPLLDSGEIVVWDIRDDGEYSGSNKRGGPRGGTIPGAIHLEWKHCLDAQGCVKTAPELMALLSQHGIRPEKPVVPF